MEIIRKAHIPGMSIYAISDLHLSFANPKPMDVFGDHWADHAEKIARNWDAVVGDDDTVLVCGDHSWALRFEEARPDIEFIATRPGRKILIRGNHDYWWRRESTNRIQREMPDGIHLMHGRGIVVENVGITGTRGWRVEQNKENPEADSAKVLNRELAYLQRGLAEIPDGVDRKIVMLHYPPFDEDMEPNEFAAVVESHGVDILVYGHIHSGGYLEGDVSGIDYRLVSADHIGFSPVLLV